MLIVANTEDDVVVKWKEGSGIILDEKVEVLQFVIKNITSQDAKGIYNTGKIVIIHETK